MSFKINKRWCVWSVIAGISFFIAYIFPVFNKPSVFDIVLAGVAGGVVFLALYFFHIFQREDFKIWIALACVTLAIFCSIAIPEVRDGNLEVKVRATGKKNAEAQSSEVFLRVMSSSPASVYKISADKWEKRSDVYVSYKDQPSDLVFTGVPAPDAFLRFVRHPYSGMIEIEIPGHALQSLDLFSATQAYVDVALPKIAVSPYSYVRSLAVFAAATLVLLTAALSFARLSMRHCLLFLLLLTTAIAALFLVKGRSYAGQMETVAFDAHAFPVRLELNAGYGFTKELAKSVNMGEVVSSKFSVSNNEALELRTSEGDLRFFHPMSGEDQTGRERSCLRPGGGMCLVELRAPVRAHVWLENQSTRMPLALPTISNQEARRFLLLERYPDHLQVFASGAYIQLSAWDSFSKWIGSLRLLDANGTPAGKLLRIVSDGVGTYDVLKHGHISGEYLLPEIERPDTPSFIAMKGFAIVAALGFVSMLILLGRIFQILLILYRDGQKISVLVSVAGCVFWIVLALLSGWPAIMGWDGLSPYIQAETGQINLWYGLGYPLMVGGILLLGKGWLVTVLCTLATLCVLLGTAAICLQTNTSLARRLAPLMLCVVLPFSAIPMGMMTHLRDATNGLMLTAFSLTAFVVTYRWNMLSLPIQRLALVLLMMFGAILILLRIDNLPSLMILLVGLTYLSGYSHLKKLAVLLTTTMCWLTVSPLLESYVMPDKESTKLEKRNYESTAMINPLVGILAHGQSGVPAPLLSDLRTTLDKVLDIDAAKKNWSPYHIIYWHESSILRGVPEEATIKHLRSLYIQTLLADPVLFMRVRLMTFSVTLGHALLDPDGVYIESIGRYPNFHDHLSTDDVNWRRIAQVAGFSPNAHADKAMTAAFINWTSRVASSYLPLLICFAVLLGFKKNPLCAVLALGAIARTGLFLMLEPASVFLYLYDMHFLGFLLPMLVLVERCGYRQAREENK